MSNVSVPWYARLRIFAAAAFMWTGGRLLPREMRGLFLPLYSVPARVLDEIESGKTFGIVMLSWGDPAPAAEMEADCRAAAVAARRRIEAGLDGRIDI